MAGSHKGLTYRVSSKIVFQCEHKIPGEFLGDLLVGKLQNKSVGLIYKETRVNYKDVQHIPAGFLEDE